MTCSHKPRFFLNDVQVGKRGQIVIPKCLRDAFGFHPGDQLVLIGDCHKGIGIMKPEQARLIAKVLMGELDKVEEPKKKKK